VLSRALRVTGLDRRQPGADILFADGIGHVATCQALQRLLVPAMPAGSESAQGTTPPRHPSDAGSDELSLVCIDHNARTVKPSPGSTPSLTQNHRVNIVDSTVSVNRPGDPAATVHSPVTRCTGELPRSGSARPAGAQKQEPG